nr:hypothetical protein [Tanacetum cinerariifolium]
MLGEGILKNVDAIFGLHLSVKFPIGAVARRSGPLLAANGFFEVVISGKGGHATIPHHAVDPVVAASNIIISLQSLVSREADPLESQVVTVVKFQGGGAFNVIPDDVTIGGTFRAFSKKRSLYFRVNEDVLPYGAAFHASLVTSAIWQNIFVHPKIKRMPRQAIPGYFFFTRMQNKNGEKLTSGHSLYFRVNEDVLPYGAAFHASLVT